MSAFIRTVRDDASQELARLAVEISEAEGKLLNLKREHAVVTAMVESAQHLRPVAVVGSDVRTGWRQRLGIA